MAKPNWLEELTENWFKIRGYHTELHVRVPPISRELDLLAFNDGEFVMVELQMNVSNKKETAEYLSEKFTDFNAIPYNPKYAKISNGLKVRRLFVSDAKQDFADLIKVYNIEYLHKEDLYLEILKTIEPYVANERWPFPDDLPLRMLFDLALWGIINTRV
jgi:hypothetical protein